VKNAKDKVRVEITYCWEFNSNEWDESLQHWDKINEDMATKVSYDPINVFFCLRNISNPVCKTYKITPI
jgi:hypothetical protein